MSLDVSIFNAIAPEYASLSTPEAERRDILSASAAFEISESVFGNKYLTALALLTAHYMKQTEHGGYAGFQTVERVGDLTQQFERNDRSGTDLGSTIYGEQFLRLRKQLVKTPAIY